MTRRRANGRPPGDLADATLAGHGVAPPFPASGPPSADDAVAGQLLTALTTEHFTLQTARNATISDSSGRATLYLGTVSSVVVALAFIGQVSRVGEPFRIFALVLLPGLFVLGLLTHVRLIESAIEDAFYARDQPDPPLLHRARRRPCGALSALQP
jgi:hypothetical protein